LGTPCWRHNPKVPGKQPPNRKERANHEKSPTVARGMLF
jgi:hypothetical protein